MKLVEYINSCKTFRNEIQNLLDSKEAQTKLQDLQNFGTQRMDVRSFYRWLGAKGLLAPHWPSNYGGKGRTHLEMGILLEELAQRNIPFTLFINSIQIAGSVLLSHADEAQKLYYLKEMAAGNKFGCVLYSEPKSGSDLSNLETTAEEIPSGDFKINGTKIYSMQTDKANFAVCATRVLQGKSKYEEMTLFLIDLKAKGITIKQLDGLSDEPFFQVILDNVIVDKSSVLGGIGKGWSILTKALAMERSGHDYFVRASRTLNSCNAYIESHNIPKSDALLVEISRLKAQVSSSCIVAYSILKDMDNDCIDELFASISKWYTGEVASRAASKCYELLGNPTVSINNFNDNDHLSIIYLSYLNAPGNRLSAGTSEMMLQTISYLGLTGHETVQMAVGA